ncbi:MAG: DUF4202 family protein [Myxococcota bacterium]
MTAKADPIERARLRISEVIAGSSVPEDPRHSSNTLEWLLRLDPGADAAQQLAALGHDIDRAVSERKIRRADFDEYDAFKAAHARNGAEILVEILRECGVREESLTREVHRLVCRHEVGGDPRADLLADADSISYFDVNLPLYHARHGREETLRRCLWGHERLSARARSIVAQLRQPSVALGALMAEVVSRSASSSLHRHRRVPGVEPLRPT